MKRPRGTTMKTKTILSLATLSLYTFASADTLYGVGHGSQNVDTFYSINTSTGAATALFTFSGNNSINTGGLTYNPVTNKFLTVQTMTAFQSQLVEIDAVAQTATVVSTGIPSAYFEGLEWSGAQGGLVISHGNGGFFSGKLALLNNTYGLISNQATTGMTDGDQVFLDGSGDLNIVDDNFNAGWQRNKIFNPFGSITSSNYGNNIYSFAGSDVDYDHAWKVDENKLFLTRLNSLATVNAAGTLISPIGSYGAGADGTLIQIRGITSARVVPEPASAVALLTGAVLLLRRRRNA